VNKIISAIFGCIIVIGYSSIALARPGGFNVNNLDGVNSIKLFASNTEEHMLHDCSQSWQSGNDPITLAPTVESALLCKSSGKLYIQDSQGKTNCIYQIVNHDVEGGKIRVYIGDVVQAVGSSYKCATYDADTKIKVCPLKKENTQKNNEKMCDF
jgi:hypothetical protein